MTIPDSDPLDRSCLTADAARAVLWVEQNIGPVVSLEEQARWRPCWYMEAQVNGATVPLYFRGDRGDADHGVYPLEHEMRVLQFLEQQELPVPHVYGFCPDPRGIVMQRCSGRADLGTAESEVERRSVLDQYVEFLAHMHSIPVSSLSTLDLPVPDTPEALALGDLEHWERQYRRFKVRPEPLIEFALRWIRSNVPPGRSGCSLVHGDAGQFLFEKGRMTAVLDLELAYVGDPAADFAGLLCRDLSEPLGDLRRALETYERCTGSSMDVRAIDYHTVRFGICTPMVTAHLAAQPYSALNWPQYLGWYLVYGRVPIEVIAKLEGVELDPPELPEGTATRHTPAATWLPATLEAAISTLDNPTSRYQVDTALRGAQYLERVDRFGAELEEQSLEDAAKLLGYRPQNWEAADAAVEEWVLKVPLGRNADILRLLHRHALRQEFLLAPAMREIEGAAVQRLD